VVVLDIRCSHGEHLRLFLRNQASRFVGGYHYEASFVYDDVFALYLELDTSFHDVV